jgi:hypothetical protein
MDDEWVQWLAKTLPPLVSNLWWNIVMDDEILINNQFVIENISNTMNLESLPKVYKEWQIILG